MNGDILIMIDKAAKKINKDNKFIDLKLTNKSVNAFAEALAFEKSMKNNAKKLKEIKNNYEKDNRNILNNW